MRAGLPVAMSGWRLVQEDQFRLIVRAENTDAFRGHGYDNMIILGDLPDFSKLTIPPNAPHGVNARFGVMICRQTLLRRVAHDMCASQDIGNL